MPWAKLRRTEGPDHAISGGLCYVFVFLMQPSAIQPVNGDPFVGMLETPVTSTPEVASYLSNLPAYRTGVAPLLRGVEIGLAHGFFLPGPFIKVRGEPCMAREQQQQ